MLRHALLKSLPCVLSTALLSLSLAGCGSQSGAGNNTAATNTAPAKPKPTPTSTKRASTAATPSAASFKNVALAWNQVSVAKANLDAVIKAQKPAKVQEAAVKLRDAVRTLPAKSKAMPAANQRMLIAHVQNVEQLSAMLDKATASKDAKQTREIQTAMNQVLTHITKLYPTGALK